MAATSTEIPAVPAVEPTLTTTAASSSPDVGASGASVVAEVSTGPSTTTTSPGPAKVGTEPSAPVAGATEGPVTDADDGIDDINPLDFKGVVATNNDLPADGTLKKLENYNVLDRTGRSHTFKSLYSGPNTARRVLIIFVRHFFCGNCQEYLRSLAASITPDALLRLPVSTFIAVVGCGDPGLIDMYAEATDCQFPIYADPTRKLYDELGMVRSLAPGNKPAYMKKSMLTSAFQSITQGLRQIKTGLMLKGGDQRQIGGEFLFEPLYIMTPTEEVDRQLNRSTANMAARALPKGSTAPANGEAPDLGALSLENTSLNANNAAPAPQHPPEAGQIADEDVVPPTTDGSTRGANGGADYTGEEKTVTWCHRMRTTRDHAEIPELMEILGLDGDGQPIKDKKRWSQALRERKGTGMSAMATQMGTMRGQAAGT